MIRRAIPNLFTLSNLFCGFISIVFTANGDFKNAAILILIGMMLDSMDGRLARMLNAQSEIGKELDSLADIVTFGVAPAILVYYASFSQYGLIGLIIAGLFPLFGAFRLARFNVNAKSSINYFTGVPITAAGGLLTLIVMLNRWIPDLIISVSFMALCFLMVSKYKIPSLKSVPLPKYGTIITALLGYLLFIIIKNEHVERPYFIYIAVPLYVGFIGYQLKKRSKNRAAAKLEAQRQEDEKNSK
ncbi:MULTISPECIES: CDP-diacylglycerol--serine O-phosphatidyltransferase [unclassified Bacillus (in: firmicutes)]|uniref:CDP-diacylglycerol--serine O-phosphatidyltransferase n=1 Tax=unclassified Bacillus (in: firmicutes) TaxID=185979 RepID=UPI0008F037AE|nr:MULTISPECIES: CDP-diacylglycerol--serine O-phosphatidyltransferase [unclassified Bacillus (in: firmicutes)]SFA70747.1 CDP-diacylglycerol---serine O-phosphatidyltransferase [Bacillus sp. UNCCL13]SFQ60694.1 CDP-diacylglycerol--serine O-phosphatidyltransferase [Bacillus sp. cl95]